MKRNDKRWITDTMYVDIDTGEMLGSRKPKNYQKHEIIETNYTENENFRIIKRTISIRRIAEQLELF